MATIPIYVEAADLINLLTADQQGQLTDDDLTADDAVTVDAVIDVFLRQAESTAESYVGGRYGVPLIDWPDSFEYAILVIARHRLFNRRGIMIDDDLDAEYKRQIAWLKDIRDSDAELYFADDSLEQDDVIVGFGDTADMDFHSSLWLS